MMSRIHRRVEALEGRMPSPEPDRSEVRARVRENLGRISYLRRSDGPEARAELEAFRVAVEHERERRGVHS